MKTFKPYTKSVRATVLVDKSKLWKGDPYKPLTVGQHSTGARNNLGRITKLRNWRHCRSWNKY